ncbi:methyltransferase domain-containing protein [Acidobacteriota bacterium]
MALRPAYLKFIHDCIDATLMDVDEKYILELGNQHIIHINTDIKEKSGKAYFTNRGFFHTSIDLNKKDGALPLDLSQVHDIPEWYNRFDIITSSGTTEHVEPYEAQYECFTNLHNWLKPGGIIVHIVPRVEELETKGSCNNYYSERFYQMLCEKKNNKLIAAEVINDPNMSLFGRYIWRARDLIKIAIRRLKIFLGRI